jgi:hypothetical protein
MNATDATNAVNATNARNDQRSTESVTVGDVQIEVTTKVVMRVERVHGALVGVAMKAPIAVVVRSPAGTWEIELE